ncbi:WD40 repeat domain-containing protein [Nocardia brasiliensis]|uniref:WD40 repeat domain-containing protein n=1 Tax=Nocardia brasiliensis TaxID=37326 RepID=UPI003D8E1F04
MDREMSWATAAGLALPEVMGGAQEGLAIHPNLRQAATTMRSGSALIVWRLAPAIEPIALLALAGTELRRGPYGSVSGKTLAFVTDTSVELRSWGNLDSVTELPARFLDSGGMDVAWSPEGRLLAVASCERLIIVDVEHGVHHEVPHEGDHYYFGDWASLPQFSPDGRRVGVANTMQGRWWHTMLTVAADGTIEYGFDYGPDGIPQAGGRNIPSAVAFTPDGRRVAIWVYRGVERRNPSEYRGVVVVIDTTTGTLVWRRHIDNGTAGRPGEVYPAALCFTLDGASLAIGLDTGIIWLDANTGAPKTADTTIGAVNALACAHHTGMLAATKTGLHQLEHPPT